MSRPAPLQVRPSSQSRVRTQWLVFAATLMALGLVVGYQLFADYQRIERDERARQAATAQVIEKSVSRQMAAVKHALDGLREAKHAGRNTIHFADDEPPTRHEAS